MSVSPKTWSQEQLSALHDSDELQIATRRDDGTLRQYITIWVVRVDDSIYVRSAHGPENTWYRRAIASGLGRIRAGALETNVVISPAVDVDHAAINAAYHAKYDRYGAKIVGSVTGPDASRVTLRLAIAND